MVLSLQTFAKSELPDWAKTDARTQGGGWIWFPGKYKATDRVLANTIAIGRAVEYLMLECNVPHKETRFVERFERQVDGIWEVYTRASVTSKQCKETKYASPKRMKFIKSNNLVQMYWTYRSFLGNKTLDKDLCNKDAPDECVFPIDREWKNGNKVKAIAYAERGCMLGDKFSCGFAGRIYWELGAASRAHRLLVEGCNGGHEIWCKQAKHLGGMIQSYIAAAK